MDWADSGAWYVAVAWAIALIALIALAAVALVQWWRRPRVKWSLTGQAMLEQRPTPASGIDSGADQGQGSGGGWLSVRADLVLANVGTGPAYGVETVRCPGAGEQPVTVFEAVSLLPGQAIRISLRVPDEEHWESCWIRPQSRLNRHRFEAGRRRYPKIPVADALAEADDPQATHFRL
ncbi:hypothetical protein [Acidipropionibacterium virtanenii]|uniref:Uncharacterized protein n=1 Tax=Acidipropionibacterium virtanenii TaxID=2057246 RepID=A0A344URC1_9ACTN|nr:hypothetical protein [Acidipropionibacterium virtanenii]AXE37819.1 hypothetical protein JS278_00628 [Acidipropionibacterium virtanenii]